MKTNMNGYNLPEMAQAMRAFTFLPLMLRRKGRRGWAAFIPSQIDATGAPVSASPYCLLDYGFTLQRLRIELARVFGAEVHDRVAFVSPRYALKNPWWGDRYGGLPSLARKMAEAGLLGEGRAA